MAKRLDQAITIRCPPELAFDLAQLALTRSGLKVKKVDASSGTIIARKGVNLRTWGNKMTVQIESDEKADDALTTMRVTSETTLIQLVDYGTNRKIIDAFELELRRLISRADQAYLHAEPVSRD